MLESSSDSNFCNSLKNFLLDHRHLIKILFYCHNFLRLGTLIQKFYLRYFYNYLKIKFLELFFHNLIKPKIISFVKFLKKKKRRSIFIGLKPLLGGEIKMLVLNSFIRPSLHLLFCLVISLFAVWLKEKLVRLDRPFHAFLLKPLVLGVQTPTHLNLQQLLQLRLQSLHC